MQRKKQLMPKKELISTLDSYLDKFKKANLLQSRKQRNNCWKQQIALPVAKNLPNNTNSKTNTLKILSTLNRL